jgi:hypothetical protein
MREELGEKNWDVRKQNIVIRGPSNAPELANYKNAFTLQPFEGRPGEIIYMAHETGLSAGTFVEEVYHYITGVNDEPRAGYMGAKEFRERVMPK